MLRIIPGYGGTCFHSKGC